MKKIRKALSVCLVLLLMMTSFPMAGIADFDICITASALDATGQCGENVTYAFDSETGELVISGNGPMTDYEYRDGSPFYNSNIKSVVIGDGVTTIGDGAFANYVSIKHISVAASVKTIYEQAFYNCIGLQEIYSCYRVGYSS